MQTEYQSDVLVIGAGSAGLRAAIAAREAGADVIVVEKGTVGKSGCTQNSASDWMAFGAAFGHADSADSPHEHWLDIMIKGALVARPDLARKIAFDAPDRLLDLERYGARFDKNDGKFVQILSDGARFPRACGKGTDTGPEIMRVLLSKAQSLGVRFVEDVTAVDLIISESTPRRVVGCWGISPQGSRMICFSAPAVVISTGGPGELYWFNVFPGGMTGDGMAMAYRAGARLVNMEFIQIGPCIIHPIKFALSGVFWRMNPKLRNGEGREFLQDRVPEEIDLAEALHIKGVSFPFSVRNNSMYVDVAIYEEMKYGHPGPHGGVFMDISHNPASEIETRARVPFEHLLERGIDLRKEPVEFAPSIQHFNGGILIDEHASTDIPGLFACGEAAGGQHGADRPGGNALADCQVYGAIAGRAAAEFASGHKSVGEADLVRAWADRQFRNVSAVPPDPTGEWSEGIDGLKAAMWSYVSVARSTQGLSEANRILTRMASKLRRSRPWTLATYLELRNLLDLGQVIAGAAKIREESRGTHYRSDFPGREDGQWTKQIIANRTESGPRFSVAPVGVPQEIADGLRSGRLKMD